MKFVQNQAFKDIVSYAKKTNQLMKPDEALNKLLHVKSGDILIIHGKNGNKVYSSFNMKYLFSVSDISSESPAKSSFGGIINLSETGHQLKRLIGISPKILISDSEIINRYSKKNKIFILDKGVDFLFLHKNYSISDRQHQIPLETSLRIRHFVWRLSC